MGKIYIIFYSMYGHVYQMAQKVKEGEGEGEMEAGWMDGDLTRSADGQVLTPWRGTRACFTR
jgi:flavodoxin